MLYYIRHNGPPGAELFRDDKIVRVIANYDYVN